VSDLIERKLETRIAKQQQIRESLELDLIPEQPLMAFDGSAHTSIHIALPFTQEDYFHLIETTGRAIRDDKRGYIPAQLPSVVQRLGIDPERWLEHIKGFGKGFGTCVGSPSNLLNFAQDRQRCWCKGVSSAAWAYRDSACVRG
jgi:hypothetical protein